MKMYVICCYYEGIIMLNVYTNLGCEYKDES